MFQREGWLKATGVIDLMALSKVENAIAKLYLMQARKISDYRNALMPDEIADLTPREALVKVLDLLEGNDKETLYQVQKFLPQSQIVRELFDHDFMDFASHLIDRPGDQIPSPLFLVEGPGLFVNRPGEVRLLYRWHSEQHYYPKRRRFLNIWIPIFGDRIAANGAMTVIPRSHLQQWDFAEYQGYNKETHGKRNHFVQYEIPDSEFQRLWDFEPVVTEARCGDAVMFHRNMVHRSNPNASDDYGFALVLRLWSPVDDLTLAGHMPVTPYGGDPGGRPGLIGLGGAILPTRQDSGEE